MGGNSGIGGGDDRNIVGHGNADDGDTLDKQGFMAAAGSESGANIQTGKQRVKHSYAEPLQAVPVTTVKGWCICVSENIGCSICG